MITQLNDIVRNNTLSPARVANALDADKVFTATGTDTYAVTMISTMTSYGTGDVYRVVIPNANTVTTPTLNVTGGSALGAKTIVDQEGNALAAGDLKAGGTYDFKYDGTYLRVTNIGGGGAVTAASIGAVVNGAAAATPNDTDLVTTVESSVVKKITWTNTKAFLKTYFDTLYVYTAATFGDFIAALTGKTTPVDADSIVLSDSAASDDAKKVSLTNFKAFLKTYFDGLYGVVIGIQDFNVPASAMWPRVTGGCASLARTEMATSIVNIQSLDFDQTTQEFAQFMVPLPRKYNNGTVTAVVYWTAGSGSGDVQWGISGGAYSNDDALTVALGTAQTVDDTLIATNDLHITSATSAITLAGTPADADFLVFQISRNPASDTLSGDAKLLAVSIRITVDSGIDA
jgi:hypothetical protein